MRYFRTLLLLMSISLLLSGCSGGRTGERLELRAESSPGLYSDSLVLYLYGATRITPYPFLAGDRLKVEYDRDTVDLFLLCDRQDGRILLPFIPDSTDLRVRIGSELSAEGLPSAPLLSEWYELNGRDTLSRELTHLLGVHRSGNLGSLLSLASAQRFPDAPLPEWMSAAIEKLAFDMKTVLGRSQDYSGGSMTLAYSFGKEHKSLKEVLRKDTMLVVSLLDSLSVQERDTAFLTALDSLSPRQYFILPETDTVPAAWKALAEETGKIHFTTDSAGDASRLLSDMNISELPLYLIADTLARVIYMERERDSLLSDLARAKTRKLTTSKAPGRHRTLRPSRQPSGSAR